MRLITKLLDKAKNRPRAKEACLICPFHWGDSPEGEWIATLQRSKKGKLETTQEGFDTMQAAEEWAKKNMSQDGEILIICADDD